ncbi:MAG: rhomboid family intramembrane serine protease [Burkholderiales bacterium]
MIPLHDDNPTSINPVITVLTIAVCVAVFLWQISSGTDGFERSVYSLGVVPAVLLGDVSLPSDLAVVPATTTLLTSMFLHGGWMHLIGNMLYLWIFGNNVEDAMGHGRFIAFYAICGVAAGLGQAVIDPVSQIPLIGASGAISGVLGAYLLLYPHARVLVAIPLGIVMHTTRLAAGWVLVFWFVLQLINSTLTQSSNGGVAWFAHIGGFVAGMALIPFFKRSNVRLFNPPRGSRYR